MTTFIGKSSLNIPSYTPHVPITYPKHPVADTRSVAGPRASAAATQGRPPATGAAAAQPRPGWGNNPMATLMGV